MPASLGLGVSLVPEVTVWDPENLRYYDCTIIPGLMGSWLYEKFLGYDYPECLSTLCSTNVYVGREEAYTSS